MDKALTLYGAFEGFDESDLVGTLTSIDREVEKLLGRYSDLWELFKTMKHSRDEEAYEVLLADDELREEFYSRLSEFGKTLGIALSSEKFLTETDEKTLSRYKADLRKFQALKASVKLVGGVHADRHQGAGGQAVRQGQTDPGEVVRAVAGPHAERTTHHRRSEERRVGKECRSRWSPYH